MLIIRQYVSNMRRAGDITVESWHASEVVDVLPAVVCEGTSALSQSALVFFLFLIFYIMSYGRK